MKVQEKLYCILPVDKRIKLEKIARKHGLTISWVIRALILHFQNNYPIKKIPKITRPKKFTFRTCRFAIYLYGNRQELLFWARSLGCEFSSLLRFILDEWDRGNLDFDPESVFTVKEGYFFNNDFQKKSKSIKRVVSTTQISGNRYLPNEYWPKNRKRNLALMTFGLSFRKYPLIP